MARNTTGNKYDSKLDIKEIAKRVRADIKAAIKSGDLPQMKVGVRLERYSGGQSLHLTIKQIDGAMYMPDRDTAPMGWDDTDLQYCVRKDLEAIADAYNYNRSDIMVDYFDVNFYATARVDRSVLRSERLTWSTAHRNDVRLWRHSPWQTPAERALVPNYSRPLWGRRERLQVSVDANVLAVALDVHEERGYDAFCEFIENNA